MSIDQNPRSDAGPLLIEDLLHEQQLLTPVARFSRKHESGDLPAQAKYYQDLIPLSEPKEGEQYAFAVDLDACTGCKACVTACHNLNGLDDEETWRDVGVLFGGTPAEPVQLTVTTACHHCVDPACMNGCPVKAYDKDLKTGIVRHLDDQCIGCSYCILKCPYDVPKHSKKRGIVRKCDMCSSRLAVGEAPACVQACPTEAIRITIVDKKQITAERKQKNSFLPSAPESDYTLPTTRYFSAKKIPANMRPADFYKIKPEHSHLPLVVMLVLTQLSVGAFSFAIALRLLFPGHLIRAVTPFHSVVALLLGLLALGASTMHLGRPLYAWRAFVGLKTSWLSREIIIFGLFAAVAVIYAGLFWLPDLSRLTGIQFWPWLSDPLFRNAVGVAVAISGILGIFCSIMIYQDTRRTFWRTTITSLKFGGTTLLLGPATILFSVLCQSAFVPRITADNSFHQIVNLLCAFVLVISIAKLVGELCAFVHLRDREWTNVKRTAMLMAHDLKAATIGRFVCGAIGGILLPILVMAGMQYAGAAVLIVCLLGELLERYLFFTAVIPPKMPGGIAS
ncbi:MAG TPA: DmsC/YnfH family molybdoenzyme membrane anchor subunit [Chthoniobacterales bacterium]